MALKAFDSDVPPLNQHCSPLCWMLQSVCVTQDLAACYACADGPRYVKERLAAFAEAGVTLDEITAKTEAAFDNALR